MALNMMKELMFWVLDRYLSRYIKNVDQVSLKGSLWRGMVSVSIRRIPGGVSIQYSLLFTGHVRLGGQKGPLEIKPEALVWSADRCATSCGCDLHILVCRLQKISRFKWFLVS